MKVLVINAGSSSLKYQLLDPDTERRSGQGPVRAHRHRRPVQATPPLGGKPVLDAGPLPCPPTPRPSSCGHGRPGRDKYYGVINSMKEIDAVGHRVVHGGEKFAYSVIIDDAVMKRTSRSASPWPPCTTPPTSPASRPARKSCPTTCRMVAVFDTAFHQTMPAKAYIYALPYEYYENDKVRRYGFHGTSHQYVSQRAADMLGQPHRGAAASPPATWATALPPAAVDSSASPSTPPWASPPRTACPWAPVPAPSTLPSPSTLSTKRGYSGKRVDERPEQEVRHAGYLRRLLRLP